MKTRILAIAIVLALAAIACNKRVELQSPFSNKPVNGTATSAMAVTNTPRPAASIEPTLTQTATPDASEEPPLAGTHHYSITPTTLTSACTLVDPFEGDVLIIFEGDDILKVSSVDQLDTFFTYTKTETNIYERMNSSGDLIRIEITATGYILHLVEKDTGQECGYYTYTLADN